MSSIDFAGATGDGRQLLPIVKATPSRFRLGGVQRGALGGAARIERMGDRWSCIFVTRVMDWEPDGRRWSGLIAQAEARGGIFRLPQPGFRSGAFGAPVVATATASGRFVPIAGLSPRSTILVGWVSIIVAGQRYADKIVTQALAAADGTATIELNSLIRVPLPAGAKVELAVPKIEGSIEVEGGEIALDGTTDWTITVTEDQ